MQKILSLAAALSLMLIAMPAHATHSGCNGVITEVGAGSETVYVDDRSTEAGSINHWFYLESNDQAGLQSGGSNAVFPDETPAGTFGDACDHANPDSLLL